MPVSAALFVIVDVRIIIIIIVIITITTVIDTSSSPRELLMPATTGSSAPAARGLKHDFIWTYPPPTPPHRVKAAPRL